VGEVAEGLGVGGWEALEALEEAVDPCLVLIHLKYTY
jgi:hypothetical protein